MIKRPPTIEKIKLMQSFYDEGNSLSKVGLKFGWRKQTLIKYINTRKPPHITAKQFKKRRADALIGQNRKMKQKLVDYKGGKCEVCNYSRCLSSIDFHHRNPKEKDFGVNGHYNMAFEKLRKEVDKCVLVCRNCHGEIHEGIIHI